MRWPIGLMLTAWWCAVVLGAAEQLWTCGMHPQIIKKEPGNCPICGMKLTPVRANEGMAVAGTQGIHLDGATVQRMNLRTAEVRRGTVQREVRAVGTVAFNEETLRDVTLKYEGWIEKLFVNTTWASVKSGEPLFEVYSPELYNAQLNYLVALASEGDTPGPLTRGALGRLQLFDVPPEFIQQLRETGKAQRTFVFRAPADGVVIEKAGVQGQMMKAGERIYRLADLSTVWVTAQIFEQDLPLVAVGQPALVRSTYGAKTSVPGKVALLVPQVEEQTRAATARIVLPNADGTWRPGMYVDVALQGEGTDSAVLVPETAILRSGERNTVFVAHDNGTFTARAVTLGARSSAGEYEVKQGLTAGERVVTSGQFMLDSESQLREAIEKMGTDSVNAAPQKGAAGTPATADANHAAPEALTGLAVATADAAAALAVDDLAAYDRQRETVNQALSAWLASEAKGAAALSAQPPSGVRVLPKPADLKDARAAFEPFSTAVTDLARAAGVRGLHAFECPMAPASGKGRWLQRDPGVRNPFFGSAMPTCGEELR